MSSTNQISSEEDTPQLVNTSETESETTVAVKEPLKKNKRLRVFIIIFVALTVILGGVSAAKYGLLNNYQLGSSSPTPTIQSNIFTASVSPQAQTSPTSKLSPMPTHISTSTNIECNESQNYVVIEADDDKLGTNFLIKYKTSSEQAIPCLFIVENNDFEFHTKWRSTFWEFAENFMILDSGTGPPPRGMIIYDLTKRQKVFEDLYNFSWTEGSGRESLVEDNIIRYWSPIDTEVTPENCPKYQEYTSYGLGVEMEAWVSLDLNTMTKNELGEYRCSSRQ